MFYNVFLNGNKIISYEFLRPVIDCFGRLSKENADIWLWKVNGSIIHIDSAIEYLIRVVPKDAIIKIVEEELQVISPRRRQKPFCKSIRNRKRNKG